ncbi:nitroreductase family protein [Serratia rhizosphaerae]|uniref:nitroreductase family protein n=1 Tax=unclassified Serratia (in: enterobacteria) TaxID=2647522 RepID=UPI000CF60438|nr:MULTISPECIES: nitroreductase family protein [unclassified Serratia (in: enterobacteria)]MBU3892384.1 nitroreductase family protein [Serratia rubidaea]AVJ17704.1 nitroreductase family protein [Serratia sp. MYb239]QNK30457.1 nitroreductase family protein [Serratia sp. JUb9]QPT11334.1 nitroreductase family protein [Serratia rubidaea]CAE1145969.1 Protein DrgA [Serratia sp. Tan611]
MNTLDAITQRRATKQFDSQHVMTLDEKKALLDIALQNAPSAFNLQHWRPLLIEDAAQRAAIREAAWDQAQVTDASMLVLLCGDLSSWESQVKNIWHEAAEPVQQFIYPAIDQYYRDKPQVQRDEIMRSSGIFAQTLMLAAKAQGYDSCPMDGFDFDAVGKIVNKPDHYQIALIVAIGKGVSQPYPRIGKLPLEQIVSVDRY